MTPLERVEHELKLDGIEQVDDHIEYKMNVFSRKENKIQLCIHPKSYDIMIEGREKYKVMKCIKTYTRYFGNEEVVFVHQTEHKLLSYWSNPNEALKRMAEELIRIFRISKLNSVMLDSEFLNESFVLWINTTWKGKVNLMDVNIQYGSPQDMRYLFENCTTSKYLGFHCNEKLMMNYIPNFETDDLLINKACQITVNDLVAISNQSIAVTLFDCSINGEEINSFLRRWMSSRKGMKMKYLYVANYAFMSDGLLTGIEYTREESENIRQFQVHDKFKTFLSGGSMIFRDDGAVALVCTTPLKEHSPPKTVVEVYFWIDYVDYMAALT